MSRDKVRAGVAVLVMLAALVAVVGASGCCAPGPNPGGETTSTPPRTTGTVEPPNTPPATESPTTLKVYFVLNEKVQPVERVVPHTDAVLAAALVALFEGPTADEQAAGLSSAVPGGTRLRGVRIANGIATVDLSRQYESGGGTLSMTLRLAQVVYTATQFTSVKGVLLQLDGVPLTVLGGEGLIVGNPQTRAMQEDSTPPILVESPAWGSEIESPVHMYGTANVFEGDFEIRVLGSNGAQLAETFAKATSGTGTRGTWLKDVVLSSPVPGPGTVRVFVFSAKDGTPQDVIDIPMTIVP